MVPGTIRDTALGLTDAGTTPRRLPIEQVTVPKPDESAHDAHAMDDHVLGQIGLHAVAPGDPCGPGLHLHLSPLLLEDDGHIDFGVLGVFLDMASSQAGPMRPFVHADISVHRIARPLGEKLFVEVRNVREGRRTSIVQIEARHAALIRLLLENNPAPDAFDKALEQAAVLKAVKPFIQA